jgi:hypothetical protein
MFELSNRSHEAFDFLVRPLQLVQGALKAIFDWFISLFEDDFLGSRTWTLTLKSGTKAYFDSIIHGASAPPGIMRFWGDDGVHDVELVWKVYN